MSFYQQPISIGIDLGDTSSRVCCLNQETGEMSEFSVAMRPDHFTKKIAPLPRGRVLIECGTQSLWVGHLLKSLGFELIVANPRNLALIAKSHMKTDRLDARRLAELCNAGRMLIQPIELRSFQTQRDLALMRTREALVRTRAEYVNRVRMQIKPFGIRVRRGVGEGMLGELLETIPAELVEVVTPSVELIRSVTAQIKDLDRKLQKIIASRYPAAQRLMTIDGVGPITALATVLHIEDVKRFKSSRTVGAYAGLTPGRFESGKTRRELSITKRGSRMWRSLLVNCAQHILSSRGKDSDLRRFGLEIAARGGATSKRKAVIAVARKLVCVMHRMLVNERDYEKLRFPDRRLAHAA